MSGQPKSHLSISDHADRPSTGREAFDIELAHQLNTLLDGALRCVDQAQQVLTNDCAANDAITRQQIDRAAERIDLASQSMRRMAAYLEQAMAAEARSFQSRAGADASATSTKSLEAAIDEVCRWLTPVTEPLGVTIHTFVSPDAAELPVGPLEAVLLNALRNAVDACARDATEGGAIEIVASRRQEILRIVIADTGTGLASIADSIEEDETAADAPQAHGHGLGLNICRRIVRDLGGDLRLMNVPFGRGAIFHMQVPIDRLSAA